MKSFKDALIFLCDIFYPKQCVLCGNLKCNEVICSDCLKNVRCDTKIVRYDGFSFERHLYLFKYEGEIRKLLLNYKFAEKGYLYDFFSKLILNDETVCEVLKAYDSIIPVPIHPKRRRERGYNQCELIARRIAQDFENLEYEPNALIKLKHTMHQSKLDRLERIENVKQIYKVSDGAKLEGKKVILFDDIFTTGSTANECSKVLRRSGAKEILVFTIASGRYMK